MLAIANIFQPLIDVFQSILSSFHSTGLSWGWSIVLLTVAVRAVLVPLTFRQIKGMVRMQALQPQMKELQQKYKQDKQRQQQEIMKFYRENKVNPLASCLPMVLQIPVFISLYFMLRESLRKDICPKLQHVYQVHYASVHHLASVAAAAGQTTACGKSAASHFLFIHDLTAKGTGIELVLLIVLYVGSQLGSTLVMSASSTMDPMQRRIMLFMPLIFVLFVIRFPAGLMLYWITTNLWTVAQQYVVRRYVGPTVAVAGAGADDDGGGPGVVSSRGGSGGAGGGGSGGLGGVGGFGERMRERLERAQSGAEGNRRGGARKSQAETAAPAKSTATTKRPAPAKKGSGSSTNGAGSSNAPPPRPPRKKKKRSGRRR
jgi:YidC/Oxa1 family membrane protein insertase